MNLKRIAAITAAAAVVAGGAGAALADAQDAQLDPAVRAGELTQAQADRIKAARKARLDEPFHRFRRGGRGHHGP